MTKFSFKFKKPYFWPISPILWRKKSFLKKYGTHKLITFSSTIPTFKETYDPIPRKQPNTVGRKDRSYFIGPFQLLLGVRQVQLQQIGI